MSQLGVVCREVSELGVVRAAKAFPFMLQVSFSEAVAYRAEFLVWMLSTTMPFVQMALMRTIAAEHPVVGADRTYGPAEFTGYFLAALLVRMLTGAWVVWEMSQEIRTGAFSMRLLRPIHPFLSDASDNLAAIPMRGLLGIPIVVAMIVFSGGSTRVDPRLWLIAAATIAGAWLINFLVNCAMGCVAFFVENATSVFEVWLALWMIFSGYLFPLDLFPDWARGILEVLPFRLMMDLPVRCITGMITVHDALMGMVQQWLWIGALFMAAGGMWRLGMRKFSAVGG